MSGISPPARSGPLREPAYGAWFGSQILSSAGLLTQNVAAAWVIFVETHSGVVLALLTVATLGPGLLLNVFAGAVLDQRSRRAVLLVTQSLSLVISVALGIVCLATHPDLVTVFALSVCTGVVNAFDGPARQVIVVDLVGAERLGKAITLYEVSLSLARTVGPAFGGVLLNVAGASACFFFNAFTFLAPLLALLLYKPRFAADRSGAGRRPSALGGLRFALADPAIRACLLVAIVVGILVSNASYYPLLAGTLHLGSAGYGTLVACLGLGSLPGALIASRFGEGDRGRRIVIAGFATAVPVALVGVAWAPYVAYVGVVLIGVGMIFLISVANTLTQLLVTDDMRGRVMGVWSMAIPGMNPVTGLATGAIADAVGPRAVFLVVAVLLVVVAAVGWRPLTASLRRD